MTDRDVQARFDALESKISACSAVKSCGRSTSRSADSRSALPSGPHKNSAHATELMFSASPCPTNFRSFASSGVPGIRARIRKLVSR